MFNQVIQIDYKGQHYWLHNNHRHYFKNLDYQRLNKLQFKVFQILDKELHRLEKQLHEELNELVHTNRLEYDNLMKTSNMHDFFNDMTDQNLQNWCDVLQEYLAKAYDKPGLMIVPANEDLCTI